MKYAVVLEKASRNYSAYVPDLPGCVATGSSRQVAERRIREAIELHLEELRREHAPIPRPTARVQLVEVSA
jgi:predicted RNase H-like HicB family nuclease